MGAMSTGTLTGICIASSEEAPMPAGGVKPRAPQEPADLRATCPEEHHASCDVWAILRAVAP